MLFQRAGQLSMPRPEVIVLDDDDDDDDDNNKDKGSSTSHRFVESDKRPRAGLKRARSPASNSRAQAQVDEHSAQKESSEDAFQRQRIMDFAAQAIRTPATGQGEAVGGGANALLAALHRERMQRRESKRKTCVCVCACRRNFERVGIGIGVGIGSRLGHCPGVRPPQVRLSFFLEQK